MKTENIISIVRNLTLESPDETYYLLDREISHQFGKGNNPYKNLWKFSEMLDGLCDSLSRDPGWSRDVWAAICEQWRSHNLRKYLVRYQEQGGPDFKQSNVAINDIFNSGIVLDMPSLIPGNHYLGSCRNAKIAYWPGNGQFQYVRTKFGQRFVEDIEHPRNDRGFDLFIPFAITEPLQHERLL